MQDEHKELTGCALAAIIIGIVAAFLITGTGDYRDEVERAAPKQLNCVTAEECEARLAAGLPLWKGEGK